MAGMAATLDRRLVRAVILAAVLGVGALVRLAPWPSVFAGEVHFLADGDPLYHLMQAEKLLAGGGPTIWHDPALNHPLGADVPWPPLFDGILAGAGWLAAGGAVPQRPALEAAAAMVPVVLGVLAVLLVAWLGQALLGGRPWIDAALVLAVLPSHAAFSSLGRPDQHALEPLLLGLVVVAVARMAGGSRGAASALLAAGVALSFWSWNGSALYLALVAGFAAAAHATEPAGGTASGRIAAWLALGLAAGALLLAVSVGLLGSSGALRGARLSGLSALQPTLVAGAAAACAALAAARRLRPSAAMAERIGTAAAALLLPAFLAALIPWTRDAIGRGVTMLAAGGWYRAISEFHPLLLSGWKPVEVEARELLSNHGLAPVAVLAGLVVSWRRWRAATPTARWPLLLFGTLALGTLVLAFARSRFSLYLSLTEALSAALVAREASAAIAARMPDRVAVAHATGVALLATIVAPVLPGLPRATWAPLRTEVYSDLAPLARFAAQVPTPRGREGVLAPWSYGHDVRYWSGRPVVASPFGTEGGEGALVANAAFHYATDPAKAEALLARRGVGLVLVNEPLDEIASLADFAPADAPPVARHVEGSSLLTDLAVSPAFRMLIVTRLWLWDGMWGEWNGQPLRDGPPALGGYRLLGESGSRSIWRTVAVPRFKLFEPVAGVRLLVRGASPRARVEARISLTTNAGRLIEWATHDFAGEDGTAELRLPYAAGANGEVMAAPWLVTDGRRSSALAPSEEDVVLGTTVNVALGR